MDKDDFNSMMGDFDEEKVQMEVAAKAVVDFYKSFREQGLSRLDAAAIVAALMRGNN